MIFFIVLLSYNYISLFFYIKNLFLLSKYNNIKFFTIPKLIITINYYLLILISIINIYIFLTEFKYY